MTPSPPSEQHPSEDPAVAVWVDDRLLPAAEARISVADRGLLTGEGVFESMAADPGQSARGRPFAMTRHLARLGRSAEIVGLPRPDLALVREAVAAVLGAHDPEEPRFQGPRRVRVTWTAGPAPAGPPRLVVTAAPMAMHPDTASTLLVPWPRNERSAVAGAKTTSYAENAVARRWADARGADEGLFAATDGRLCEGATSNVFVAVDGVLATPTLATGCLPGVTRGLVLEWCAAVEQDFPVEDLERAEEVFLTSATRVIQPVRHYSGAGSGLGSPRGLRDFPAPGPLTRRAAEAFAARAADDPDP